MSIELILISVMILVFFSDFLIRGINKNQKQNQVVPTAEEKKPISSKNWIKRILLGILFGVLTGLIIDNYIGLYSSSSKLSAKAYCLYKLCIYDFKYLIGGIVLSSIFFLNPYYPSINDYLRKRKKNTVLFLILIPLMKIILHYSFYPIMIRDNLGGSQLNPNYSEKYRASVGEHTNIAFSEELWLFIPSILIVSLIAWFFSDRIKAR